jgi:serine/threonine protein kinase
VIHRDLKPGNFFLTLNGELKLGDFGIARDLTREDLTEKGKTVGTYAYMAPEQIRGESSVSQKADLYALGCCLFEMLTCRKLFRGDNFRELYDQHLKELPPRVRDFRRDVPDALDALIDQLLSKSPEDRPFNARQVQARLLEIQSEPLADQSAQENSSHPLENQERLRQQSRQTLVDRIRNPHLGAPQQAVSMGRLLVIVGIVLAMAAAAAWAKA